VTYSPVVLLGSLVVLSSAVVGCASTATPSGGADGGFPLTGSDASADRPNDSTPVDDASVRNDASQRSYAPPPSRLVASGETTCLLDIRGELTCWGMSAEAPAGEMTPRTVFMGDPLTNFGVSPRAVFGLRADGSALSVGNNAYGLQARGSEAPFLPAGPIAGVDFVSISGGLRTVCALDRRHGVWCWGRAADGMTDPIFTDRRVATPTRIEGLPAAVAVVAASQGACALTTDGSVFCWGDNAVGQCGVPPGGGGLPLGSQRMQPPLRVPGLGSVIELVGSLNSFCAREADHTVRCWGNVNASLGITDPALGHVKTVVDVPLDATALSVTWDRVCYVRRGGIAECRGARNNAQLGDGVRSETPERRFVPITRFVDIEELALGLDHSCALRRDGSVWCWGSHRSGSVDGVRREFQFALDPIEVISAR